MMSFIPSRGNVFTNSIYKMFNLPIMRNLSTEKSCPALSDVVLAATTLRVVWYKTRCHKLWVLFDDETVGRLQISPACNFTFLNNAELQNPRHSLFS